MRKLQELSKKNSSIGALLGVMTGVVVAGMGALTLNPVLIGVGGTIMAAGTSGGGSNSGGS